MNRWIVILVMLLVALGGAVALMAFVQKGSVPAY
jgi:hypothetical protein